MSNPLLRTALARYKKEVSIAKKGFSQENYRVAHLCNSFLGDMHVRKITSKDIATYRDERLATVNARTKRTISNATVRLEMSLLSNFFDIARIEWGYCDANPVINVRKPKPSPGRERRISPREERQIIRYAHEHPNRELKAIFILAIETAMMEIAAISGHKSLAMLKRYTHLKAASLARKLEGPKNRAKAAVLSHMVPYPALVQRHEENISIRLLDFEGLEVYGSDLDSVTDRARDALMRKLMHLIRESAPIPSPDQYLDPVPDEDVFMLDPLGVDSLLQNFRESSSLAL